MRFVASFIWVCVALTACKPDPRMAEEARRRALDSAREVAELDSLRKAADAAALLKPLQLVGEPRLDSVGSDCFRVIALFSWGVSPIGPMLSIRGCRDGSNYILTVHKFVAGNDPNDASQRKRRKVEATVSAYKFLEISNYLDSINFNDVPTYLEFDNTVIDASEYYLEVSRSGHYHYIVRDSRAEPFVYDLFVKASMIAGIDALMVAEFKRLESEARKGAPQDHHRVRR